MTRHRCTHSEHCPGEDILGAYVDAECAEREAAWVSCSLARCGLCRERVRDLQDLADVARLLRSERAPAGLEKRMLAGLHAAKRRERASFRVNRRSLLAASFGAVSAAGVTIGVWQNSATSILNSIVQDFSIQKAKGWTVDKAAPAVEDLMRWAEMHVNFQVPRPSSSISGFAIDGIRLCWLIERKLISFCYTNGDRHAALYVMEARGISALLLAGRNVVIMQHGGHRLGYWRQGRLLNVLIGDDPGFDYLFVGAMQSAFALQSRSAGS